MKQGEAYWTSHVEAMQKEKMPVSAYAKQHGLTASCLYYWQGKLKAAATAPKPSGKFLALRVTENAPSAPAGCVLVLATGVRLELTALPAPEWLASFALAAQGMH